MKRCLILLLLALLATAGCMKMVTRDRYENRLHYGMTKEQVEDIFGEPDGSMEANVWKYVKSRDSYAVELRFDKNDRLFQKEWKDLSAPGE